MIVNQVQEVSPFGEPTTPQQAPTTPPQVNMSYGQPQPGSNKEKSSAMILFATGLIVGAMVAWLVMWLLSSITGQVIISGEQYAEYQQQTEVIQQLQDENDQLKQQGAVSPEDESEQTEEVNIGKHIGSLLGLDA